MVSVDADVGDQEMVNAVEEVEREIDLNAAVDAANADFEGVFEVGVDGEAMTDAVQALF